MIIAVDIGNTNIVLGCAENNEIIFRERIATNQTATDLEYAVKIRAALEMNGVNIASVDGAIISSVVPSVTGTVKAAIVKLTGVDVMVVGPGIRTGLSIMIDNPAQLGSDLAVVAVAGIAEYKTPLILIDMGTATTLSVIDSNNNYIGGAIMTGTAVSTDALISRTAQLPKIAFEKPKKVIGSNTIDCLKSGIMFSNAAAIDGMIERIEDELGEQCTVVATGGLSGVIIPLCKRKDIILDDAILLKGLMLIYNKNKR